MRNISPIWSNQPARIHRAFKSTTIFKVSVVWIYDWHCDKLWLSKWENVAALTFLSVAARRVAGERQSGDWSHHRQSRGRGRTDCWLFLFVQPGPGCQETIIINKIQFWLVGGGGCPPRSDTITSQQARVGLKYMLNICLLTFILIKLEAEQSRKTSIKSHTLH